MGTTALVAEFTKTYFAPPLTHLSAHALWPAFAPFAPQPLSLIHPVQLSAFAARLTATNITAVAAIIFISFFIPGLLILWTPFVAPLDEPRPGCSAARSVPCKGPISCSAPVSFNGSTSKKGFWIGEV